MSRLEGIPASLSFIPFAMTAVVIAVGLLRVPAGGRAGPAELVASLALGLELLLAAGLLRLSSIDSFAGLGMVAAIILLRRLIGIGVRAGLRALGAQTIRLIRA